MKFQERKLISITKKENNKAKISITNYSGVIIHTHEVTMTELDRYIDKYTEEYNVTREDIFFD